MTDNARKIFDILGVEPNERFKIKRGDKIFKEIYYFDERIYIHSENDDSTYIPMLNNILNGEYKIIKLTKKKKKLRDLTPEEYEKWSQKNCYGRCNCDKCIFNKVKCNGSSLNRSWVDNKDLYSDKFLDQEIEVEE